MITTISIKEKLREVFEVGTGEKNVLILGSCRTVAYLNYLNRWNRSWSPEPFRIFVIEPNNYHWDEHGSDVDLNAELEKLEDNERILSIIRGTEIFIHEHYAHFKMFNTDKTSEKNIYQFGMNPKIDIQIPNFHDHFILEQDYSACGIACPDDYIKRGEAEIEKFCNVCEMSSFPEFGNVFKGTWKHIRYFWRPNHTSSRFTMAIFALMNEQFLRLPLTREFWDGAATEDLFREPHTQVTQRDIDGYGLQWS